jgi:hypothetical protein
MARQKDGGLTLAAAQVEYDVARRKAHGPDHARGEVEGAGAEAVAIDVIAGVTVQLLVIGAVWRAKGGLGLLDVHGSRSIKEWPAVAVPDAKGFGDPGAVAGV